MITPCFACKVTRCVEVFVSQGRNAAMCPLRVCTLELPTTPNPTQTQERESTSCRREPKIIPLLWTDRLFCNFWIQTKSYLCKRRTNLCYSDCEKYRLHSMFFLLEDRRSWVLKPGCGYMFDWLLHIQKTVNKMIKCKQACASKAYKPRPNRILWAAEWKNKDYRMNHLIRTSLKLIQQWQWTVSPVIHHPCSHQCHRRLQLPCCQHVGSFYNNPGSKTWNVSKLAEMKSLATKLKCVQVIRLWLFVHLVPCCHLFVLTSMCSYDWQDLSNYSYGSSVFSCIKSGF